MNKRCYSLIDRLLMQIERGLTAVCADLPSQRPNPAATMAEPVLSPTEHQASSEMMRVNHAGEICAQALYYGQMATVRSPSVAAVLAQAADEEADHLAWTAQRLKELGTHRSYLNFFWYSQSFMIGLIAGLFGDRWSLGFLEETEHQVTHHLTKHLGQIPPADAKSQAIIAQMRQDEQQHSQTAAQSGAIALPLVIKKLMALQAKAMTTVAARI